MRNLFIVLTLVTSAVSFAADTESSPNCKLVIQTKFKTGKKRVEVTEVFAETRDACKEEARSRELASVLDSDIEKMRVTFGWRGPAL